ncbi:ABC transporter substrate-binding protein [Azospirillum doebereinerae]|uniref:ABC transporter substrate-binding protein n=1 Tax=Azospirillum doebereinerae TaxID=92933 RepID=A0A433J493_9PROT|nr:ABC transporter substrate-binding protein [Azospirillum doebereinerae]MCG5238318.1 ABC transporter substrate-binding protein [Azospirillum doebereinerae]RUQ66799.1 ABC transporter substrate-binding protein [Azospirillum doebereinerae]
MLKVLRLARRLAVGGVIVAGALSGPALAAETLKIGVVGGLTGPGAAWGLAIDAGAKIAAAEINAKGGLSIGGKPHTVEVVSYDDQYKAASAVTAVNRLIDQDEVKFILGPIGSASLLAIKPITERNKVILLSNTYTAKALENTGYVFRVLPTTQEYNASFIDWLKTNRPAIRSVALLSPNDETGWNSQKVQTEAYGKAGFTIAAAELFERQQTDFRAVLTRILASKPDAIELDTTPPPTAGLVVRQARELGFSGQFTKFGGVNVAEIVKGAGAENAEGMLGYFAADPDSKEWAWLQTEYAKHHPNEMSDFTFFFYDAAKLLLAAIGRAGTATDTDAVRAQIEQGAPFDTLLGKAFWGGKAAYGIDHQLVTPSFLGEIQKGKGKVIARLAAQ